MALYSVLGWFLPTKIKTAFWNSFMLVFFRYLLHIVCGLKIEVRGEEHILKGQGAIYASRHQSELETYMITSFVKGGATYIFKKELSYIPLFGWAVAAYGAIPIDRSGGSSAMKNMLNVAKIFLAKGRSIVIFPEGTRTKPGKIVPYKPGVAFLYQNLDATIIPVAHNTGLFWKKRSFLKYPGKIIFEFMPPIEKNLDKKDFMDKLRDAIETKCNEINRETVKNYPYTEKFIEK
ncbi:MAG: lysophospholipid acyltransferase family protein [Alphaproteobacteria bacterium]